MSFCTKKSRSPESETGDIPKSVRITCILQLCIVFSMLLWIAGKPFTEQLYEYRKGTKQLEWLIDLHPEKYENVSQGEKEILERMRSEIERGMQESFGTKFKRSIEALFLDTPLSKLMWIVLAGVLSIMIMKQKEGAREAVWLLPLLAIVYAIQIGNSPPMKSPYPSEEYLEKHYMHGSIGSTLEEQRTQLESAWQKYLATEWSTLPAGTDEKERLGDGLYQFTLKKSLSEWKSPPEKPGPWTLGCYVLWNLFFTGLVYRKMGKREEKVEKEERVCRRNDRYS